MFRRGRGVPRAFGSGARTSGMRHGTESNPLRMSLNSVPDEAVGAGSGRLCRGRDDGAMLPAMQRPARVVTRSPGGRRHGAGCAGGCF